MGALVTVELAQDAPERDLPWIITFGPLDDDGSWDPVVCGPYERPHALALAQDVVADDQLIAVVEPLLPKVSVDEIRGEIDAARRLGAAEADDYLDDPFDDDDEDIDAVHSLDEGHGAPPPSAADVRAGFARIFARLG
ncbi:hypothetical protein [Pilimelia columellifera]|uniref:hypothetical protein n=1 Tax=Pilimelia columellifera TaxID=706574 RepID=UPI0031DDAB66